MAESILLGRPRSCSFRQGLVGDSGQVFGVLDWAFTRICNLRLVLQCCRQDISTVAVCGTERYSGGFRNLERGVQLLVHKARAKIFGLPRPLSVTLAVPTEYLEATLGLVKRLEISKELIRECVTVPGCCCCMPLLHNHLMDLCSYIRKNILLTAKRGVHLHPPYSP